MGTDPRKIEKEHLELLDFMVLVENLVLADAVSLKELIERCGESSGGRFGRGRRSGKSGGQLGDGRASVQRDGQQGQCVVQASVPAPMGVAFSQPSLSSMENF